MAWPPLNKVRSSCYAPLKQLADLEPSAFARFSQPGLSLLLQKLVFIACNLGLFALGVWKCQSMGLLPTASSDWLAWKAPALVRP